MKRREFFAAASLVSLSGCIAEVNNLTSSTNEPADSSVEERVIECERRYIRTEVITREDETIEDSLEPEVVGTESRSGDDYVELETRFGTTRSTEDGPDEHVDHLVTAYYLVAADEVYRAENAEKDPRDGTTVDC